MDKRYQVFVSSTFADLKEERRRIIQTLMEMDCIPAGMELFPAADEEQWAFIRTVIDDCDYYLLLIGGRYGSTTSDGVSYTEKEYDYAVERGIKVLALLHEKPDEIPLGKSELDPAARNRLQAFREKAATGRLVRFWSKAEDLPGLVALSLSKTIKTYPAIGWVRADGVANEDLLSQLNQVRQENDSLREQLSALRSEPVKVLDGLASLDEEFVVHGTRRSRHGTGEWTAQVKWRDIFAHIAPYLLKHPSESYLKSVLCRALKEPGSIATIDHIEDQDFQTITLQLKALGLVNVVYSKTTQGGMALFWQLTPEGDQLMMQLRTMRSGQLARE
jgi:Domain of unknown function (DUF4062)